MSRSPSSNPKSFATAEDPVTKPITLPPDRPQKKRTESTSKASALRASNSDLLKVKLEALDGHIKKLHILHQEYPKSFFDLGLVLADISDQKLYEVKGYSSFETFAEREMDLGKQTCLNLVQIVKTFQREAAQQYDVAKLAACLQVLDGTAESNPPPSSSSPRIPRAPSRSPIPFHKR